MSEVNLPSGFAGEIKCTLTFNLANGKNFSLSTGKQAIKANYIKSVRLEEKFSTNTDMPVGVNNGNVLNIE